MANHGIHFVPFHRGGKHHPKDQVTPHANPVTSMAMPELLAASPNISSSPNPAATKPGHWVHLRTTRCLAVARINDC